MKKNYIKLNDNDEHLSLGNLFRVIKDISKNKTSAMQSEIFCTMFNIESINDTTVNNYCVGCRGISGEYKQVYLNMNNKYKNNKEVFANIIIGLLSIIDGNVYIVDNNKIDFINNNSSCEFLVNKLYSIAKNDKEVKSSLISDIKDNIKNNNYYDALVSLLLFIVLYKKQPIYEEELKKEVIDNILSDTSISSVSLQEYLSLKLREGINYIYSLKQLAMSGNAYANFEMGTNEFYGYYAGYPRYDYSLNYLLKAADMDHAGANYMVGNMYVKGFVGSKSNEELKKGYEYLKKAFDLGNIAASNVIGNMYHNGIYPLNKDINKALEYYNYAADNNYVYALNNLGIICENNKEYDKAFEYYLKSASLGESWACNKVGEYYRTGVIEKNMEKAFNYYNKAIDSEYRLLCNYAYYNLATYFYLDGYDDIVPVKDKNTAINYLSIASSNGCFDASLKLLFIYIDEIVNENDNSNYDNMLFIKNRIENDSRYNEEIANKINDKLKNIKNKKTLIDISDIIK